MTFPPLDHENSKLRALPITLFQSLAQYLHLVHKECLLKSNEATRQVLVVTSTPPSCHVERQREELKDFPLRQYLLH